MSARTFRYTALDPGGRRREGAVEARDRANAIDLLKAQRLIVTELLESAPGAAAGWRTALGNLRGGRLSGRDLAVFTRELAALLTAGLQMTRALDILCEDVENPHLLEALVQVKHAVEGGQTLSSALRQHPRLFPAFYANLVEAGEVSGEMSRVLDRLATYVEWVEGMRRRAVGALTYPAMVMIFSAGLVAGLVLFLLPRFTEIYRSLGSALPWPTAALLGTSTFLIQHGWWIAPLLIGGGIVGSRLLRTEAGRLWRSRTSLRLPLLGPLVARFAITRFARTLAMLYQGGIPILTALELAARTCGNEVYFRALLRCRESVGSGGTLASALRGTGLFPSVMVSMIDVGERSGGLVEMLNRAAEFHEAELDAGLEGLTAMLEPLLIIWVGVLIGGLVLVLFLPIMNLQQLL